MTEQQPELVGEMEALERSVRYPEAAKTDSIEGKVCPVRQGPGGHCASPQLSSGDIPCQLASRFYEEVRRAVKSQEFRPGKKKDGTPVKVQRSLPVTFAPPSGN